MIRKIIVVASLLLLAGVLEAEDQKFATLKVGTEIYTNVIVTSVTATDIYFSHSRGLGNAKLKTMDAELQKQFHFDPTKAAEKEKQQAEGQVLYGQALRESKPAKSPQASLQVESEMSPGSEDVPTHEIFARSFLNQAAPGIIGEKWLTQAPALKGKFVLLNFWASWSGPCRNSIPALNAFANRFKDRLVIIGLTDEPEEEVRKMTDPRIDYFVAIDTQHRASSAVGVGRIPHALLIDPHGIVRFEGNPGYLDEGKLEKLLARYSE